VSPVRTEEKGSLIRKTHIGANVKQKGGRKEGNHWGGGGGLNRYIAKKGSGSHGFCFRRKKMKGKRVIQRALEKEKKGNHFSEVPMPSRFM